MMEKKEPDTAKDDKPDFDQLIQAKIKNIKAERNCVGRVDTEDQLEAIKKEPAPDQFRWIYKHWLERMKEVALDHAYFDYGYHRKLPIQKVVDVCWKYNGPARAELIYRKSDPQDLCLSLLVDQSRNVLDEAWDIVVNPIPEEDSPFESEILGLLTEVILFGQAILRNASEKYSEAIVNLLVAIECVGHRCNKALGFCKEVSNEVVAVFCWSLREHCLQAERAIAELSILANVPIDGSVQEIQGEKPVTLQAAKAETKIPIPTIRRWMKSNPPKIRHIKKGGKVYVWVSEVKANI